MDHAHQTTELAKPTSADFGGGLAVRGREEATFNLSRMALYQGTPTEEQLYGRHHRGVWIDTLDQREFGEKILIMPVLAQARYALWEKGANFPRQTWDKKSDVPVSLLEWTEQADGKRIPPQATESIDVVCVVAGAEWPYLITFKKTSLKAFEKTVNPVEVRRSGMQKTPGLYELYSIDDKNADGQAFKRLQVRIAGDPPAEMVDVALKVYRAQAQFREVAKDLAAKEEAGEFDPDSE